ncbi:hypothetical protein VP1G_00622 [Cytospora mali]|uniref:Uncharacterized protein n=1 Tax=Cytospora mali TaxID=578113 RepID=A0A194UNP6_CYTMA|nr:hypothetical protein VP1G_00622 [Valsa mali var. pyri (nom. inval.)]
MELNSGLREMILALRAAMPDMGLKKLTAHVNACLPPDIKVEKHSIRDFVRGLDNTNDPGTATEEASTKDTATEVATVPTAALKPRDGRFKEVTKSFFRDFRSAERQYLLNLDSELSKKLRSGEDGVEVLPDTYPVSHVRHYMEVLFVLKGLKPCTLFFLHHHDDSAARSLTGVVVRCLAPALERFDIESYGFTLHYIATDVLTMYQHNYNGAWVLADTESSKWSLVRDVFFKAEPERVVPEQIICSALGYPVKVHSEMECQVQFKDDDEWKVLKEILGEDKVCCVDGVEFACSEGDPTEWQDIMHFFDECRDAALEVGTQLQICADLHPALKAWDKENLEFD